VTLTNRRRDGHAHQSSGGPAKSARLVTRHLARRVPVHLLYRQIGPDSPGAPFARQLASFPDVRRELVNSSTLRPLPEYA
jgi:hypothetical protein